MSLSSLPESTPEIVGEFCEIFILGDSCKKLINSLFNSSGTNLEGKVKLLCTKTYEIIICIEKSHYWKIPGESMDSQKTALYSSNY